MRGKLTLYGDGNVLYVWRRKNHHFISMRSDSKLKPFFARQMIYSQTTLAGLFFISSDLRARVRCACVYVSMRMMLTSAVSMNMYETKYTYDGMN